tara:strand:+ start:22453 stop:24102 length:1650 start_codon:yes stop_codon:yes gene_type:complete
VALILPKKTAVDNNLTSDFSLYDKDNGIITNNLVEHAPIVLGVDSVGGDDPQFGFEPAAAAAAASDPGSFPLVGTITIQNVRHVTGIVDSYHTFCNLKSPPPALSTSIPPFSTRLCAFFQVKKDKSNPENNLKIQGESLEDQRDLVRICKLILIPNDSSGSETDYSYNYKVYPLDDPGEGDNHVDYDGFFTSNDLTTVVMYIYEGFDFSPDVLNKIKSEGIGASGDGDGDDRGEEAKEEEEKEGGQDAVGAVQTPGEEEDGDIIIDYDKVKNLKCEDLISNFSILNNKSPTIPEDTKKQRPDYKHVYLPDHFYANISDYDLEQTNYLLSIFYTSYNRRTPFMKGNSNPEFKDPYTRQITVMKSNIVFFHHIWREYNVLDSGVRRNFLVDSVVLDMSKPKYDDLSKYLEELPSNAAIRDHASSIYETQKLNSMQSPSIKPITSLTITDKIEYFWINDDGPFLRIPNMFQHCDDNSEFNTVLATLELELDKAQGMLKLTYADSCKYTVNTQMALQSIRIMPIDVARQKTAQKYLDSSSAPYLELNVSSGGN